MVRLLWLVGFAAAVVVQAEQQQEQPEYANVDFDSTHMPIGDSDMTMAVFPTVLHPDSPLLNTTNDAALQKRRGRSISVVIGEVTRNVAVIVAGEAAVDLYKNIATKIKSLSDRNSCTLVFGTDLDDGYHEGYAYQATTTGKKCDTTALQKTIVQAVQDCATKLHNVGAVLGCCNFDHGGTWHGHLRLSASPSKYNARDAKCP